MLLIRRYLIRPIVLVCIAVLKWFIRIVAPKPEKPEWHTPEIEELHLTDHERKMLIRLFRGHREQLPTFPPPLMRLPGTIHRR
jgi:hypothetical protein